MENQSKQSFVMYASFYDAAQELNDEDFREYILALKDFALFGIEYTSRNPMVNALLTMAQPNIEAASKRRAKQVKNGEYGILGGRPRKGETAEEYKARKAALRKNLMGLESETLNNPIGFQPGTLNEDVKVDENEKENVDVNPDVEENSEVNKNTNQIMKNDSIFTNALDSSNPLTPGFNMTGNGEKLEERRPRQEVVSSHSNENPDRAYHFNYKCGNYVNLEDVEPGEPDWINCDPNDFPPLVDEGWTPPPPESQHNEVIIPKETRDNTKEKKEEPARLNFTKEKIERLMAFERNWANTNKSMLTQQGEEYCDGAFNILDNDLHTVRRCFECLNRGKGKRVAIARDRVHELISSQMPNSEDDYIEILRDLWKFYIQDRADWDSRIGKPEDEFNPYRKMQNE